MSKDILKGRPHVLNVGTPIFLEDLRKQGADCVQVDWKPAAGGDPRAIAALDRLLEDPAVDAANALAAQRLKEGHPVWCDMGLAGEVIPDMTATTILHAGPPIAYEQMCGPMRGAVVGALLFEELAKDEQEADALARSGEITFSPCHSHGAVGPMAGVISASMPVHIVRNEAFGNLSFAGVNEGLGKVLRFGAYDGEVIHRLRFIRDILYPVLRTVVRQSGGIDLKNLTAQGLHMGDECHNRNKAATSLLIRELLPFFRSGELDPREAGRTLDFINGNDHYFLNLSMAACKSILDAIDGLEHCTLLTAMARNGVEFGIRIAGLPGWYTGPAMMVEGLLFPGFEEKDANPDLGDSAITETCGIGGFAMAAAPAIVQFVGGCVDDALAYSRQMFEITETENPSYTLPPLDFRGSALGIDLRKVLATGILPVINTGIAHRQAGVGQVGAGVVHPHQECFQKAILAF